jgi:23S rRNA (adenine2503-C2)-methyltransferase
MKKLQNIFDLDKSDLKQLLVELGQPSYRASQVWHWIYDQNAIDFNAMTNLPKELRQELSDYLLFSPWDPEAEQYSKDNQTKKVLFKLADDNFIETVLMRYQKRRTLCISTQAGCAMGCVFCATGQMGFFRNLTVGEIVQQVMFFARELSIQGERVTNIVMMGMGEPLHNYENTLSALDILTDEEGFNLSARKITISTVGLVPAIRRYAEEGRQTPLAVSLHAATDKERNELIPISRRWSLAELIDACHYYVTKTGRRITFEWALIEGKNDSQNQARLLGQLVKGLLCHVNLIPLNPTNGYGGRPTSRVRVEAFQKELSRHGVSSTVRLRRGIDIQAGCGQLRDRIANNPP